MIQIYTGTISEKITPVKTYFQYIRGNNWVVGIYDENSLSTIVSFIVTARLNFGEKTWTVTML